MNYKEYINSDQWKKIRQIKLKMVDHCQICNKKKNLHVHHKTYRRFQNEDIADLMILCSSCHALWHAHLPKLQLRHKHISRLRTAIKFGMSPKMAFIFYKNRVEYGVAYTLIFNKMKSGELNNRLKFSQQKYLY